MKPFARMPTRREKFCDCRLPRVKRIVENVFGILVSRFFKASITLSPVELDHIVLTACSLHNWLHKIFDRFITQTCVDYEDIQQGEMIPGSRRHQIET